MMSIMTTTPASHVPFGRRMKAFGLTMLGGALAFWGPDVLVHLVAGKQFSGAGILLLSPLLPTTATFGFFRMCRLFKDVLPALWVGAATILGVWLLGPLFMMVSFSFSGGGFATQTSFHDLVTLITWAPLMTFIMSTYDGSLAAIALVTLGLPIAVVWASRPDPRETGSCNMGSATPRPH